MMPQKLLHELLQQDQEEPLLLHHQQPSPKPKSISHFCNAACFLAPSSPPLFQFLSPPNSPSADFLHVPAATRTKSNVFGLLGSFLKRFTHRRRNSGPIPPLKMAVNQDENDSVSRQSNFCDSPFRFALQSTPSAGHRTPEFSSPARHDHQVNDVESKKKSPGVDEEEEKEQNSPVSVLDPPFEDEDEGRYEDHDEDEYDLERSYAIVQKTKHQLLKKLRRFERLAKLDPVELEALLLKDDEDELEDDYDIDLSNHEKDTKRLVCNRDEVVTNEKDEMRKKVYMRSELWKRADSSAIDVMVGQDLKAAELEGWNRNREQRGEIGIDIEVEIFRLLVEEMQTEVCINNL